MQGLGQTLRPLSVWDAMLSPMTGSDPKADLHRYLNIGRDALLWKLEGLTEYDLRRPLTPTGTNLLGLVKHVAGCEIAYFGDTFGRPFEQTFDWMSEDGEPNADMWATADESRADILGLYERVRAHSDATITALTLESLGRVPHWAADRNTVTLHRILIHLATETHRHAGHADIVRELIDGAAGLRVDAENMPSNDPAWWDTYRERLEKTAREAQ